MIKHVVTMDTDDFETLKVLIHQLKYNANKLVTSYTQGELLRYIRETEELLGMSPEPPPIPEAVTAKWRDYRQDHINLTGIASCGCCGTTAIVDIGVAFPGVCPNCKAVMNGVE